MSSSEEAWGGGGEKERERETETQGWRECELKRERASEEMENGILSSRCFLCMLVSIGLGYQGL